MVIWREREKKVGERGRQTGREGESWRRRIKGEGRQQSVGLENVRVEFRTKIGLKNFRETEGRRRGS